MAARKKGTGKHKADEILIPDKLYFRIGEVATLCHLPAYVLRFWESEFPQLKPVKSSTGQRMYRKRDVEFVVRIKRLLYENGFTIAGARAHLREETKAERNQSALNALVAKPHAALTPAQFDAQIHRLADMNSGGRLAGEMEVHLEGPVGDLRIDFRHLGLEIRVAVVRRPRVAVWLEFHNPYILCGK